jgi:hypothetical protein
MNYAERPKPTFDVALAAQGMLASVRQADAGWVIEAPGRKIEDVKLDHALARFLDCAPGIALDLAMRVAATDAGGIVVA